MTLKGLDKAPFPWFGGKSQTEDLERAALGRWVAAEHAAMAAQHAQTTFWRVLTVCTVTVTVALVTALIVTAAR